MNTGEPGLLRTGTSMTALRSRMELNGEALRQATRFLVAGVGVTAIHAAVAAACIHFGSIVPAVAHGIAFIIANLCSYLIHTLWSFSSTPRPRNFTRFAIVSLLIFAISTGVPGLIDFAGGHYGLGIAAVTLIVPPTSFLLHRYYTYR